MRYFGWLLFSLAVLSLVCWTGMRGYGRWEAWCVERLDVEAREYLVETLPLIFEGEGAAYLDPGLFSDEESKDSLANAFGVWRKLGAFRGISKVDFVKLIPGFRRAIFYVIEVEFREGRAQVTAVVDKQGSAWTYRYLNIDLSSIADPYIFSM